MALRHSRVLIDVSEFEQAIEWSHNCNLPVKKSDISKDQPSDYLFCRIYYLQRGYSQARSTNIAEKRLLSILVWCAPSVASVLSTVLIYENLIHSADSVLFHYSYCSKTRFGPVKDQGETRVHNFHCNFKHKVYTVPSLNSACLPST